MEEEMITRLKSKDFTGLEQLVQQYGPSILRTIRGILRDGHERSEWEATENEVLYTIWEKITNFDSSKASFTTWVLMITRSKAIDQKRRLTKMYQQQKISDTSGEVLGIEEVDPLEEEEFVVLIEDLSEEDQRIFLLFYFYQETPQQIAEILQLSPAIIYNRLSRGRRKLKDILSKRGEYHGT